MSDPIVGIDLGTSNSVVAHADAAGHVKVLADDGGYKIHPSVVSFHPNGGVVVGAGAKQRKVIDPQNTIYSVKRLIGRAYESAEVQIAKRRVPYQIKEGPNRAPLIVTRGGEFAVPEISAIVLDHVRNIGSARLGTQVSRAVVTVPASFNDAQRSATATAGAIAGLTVVRVLNEPTAAALAYGHSRNLRQTIAVYDFGGGTFDITLLKLDDQVYEVLGTAGDTFLGGDDLDERLVDKMVAKFLAENRIDLRTNEVSMMRLRAVAEQTKIELSRRSRAVVRIDEIAYGPRGVPLNLQIEISRDEFVHEVADIIDRTFPVCQEALTIAGVGINQIDDIILVGGTTKIPYVRDQVSKFFSKAPRTDVNPEDAVAIGAALQAVSLERVLSKPRTGRLAAQKQFPEDEDTLNRAAGTTNTSIDLVDTGGQAVVMQPPEVSPPEVPRPKRSTANYDEREVQLPDTSYRVTRGNVRDVVDKANELRPPTRPPEEEATAPNPPIVIPPASNALPPPPTDDTSYTLTRSGQKDTYTEKARKDPLAPTSGEITRPGAPVPNLDDMLAPKGAFEEMGLAPVSAKQEMGIAPKAIGRMSRPVATPPPLPTAPAGPQAKQTLFGVPPGPDPKRPAPRKPGEVGNTTDVIRSLQADQTTTHGPRPTPPADSQPTLPRHAPPRAFTDSDDFTDEGQAFRTPLPSGLTPLPSTTAPMSPVAPIAPATAPTLVALAPDFAAEVDSVTAATTNKLLEQQAAASSTAKGMGPVNTLNLPPPTGMHPATTAKGFPPPQAQPPDPSLAPPLRPAPLPVAPPPPPSPFIPQQPPQRLPPAPLPLAPPPPVPMAPPNAQTLYVPPAPPQFQAPASAPAPLPLPDLPGWPAQAPGWEQSAVQPPPVPQGLRPAPVLLEVTPRGLGIATVAGYCEELIRRNSRLPTEMKKLFTTSRDRQDIVRIVVCQGESRRMDKNVVIGDLVLQGLPPRPRGETSIEVTFFVDASGVLQVSARDALTGNEQRASLDLVGGMQDVAASRERIQRLRSDAS